MASDASPSVTVVYDGSFDKVSQDDKPIAKKSTDKKRVIMFGGFCISFKMPARKEASTHVKNVKTGIGLFLYSSLFYFSVLML
jgi:hypothetical protein